MFGKAAGPIARSAEGRPPQQLPAVLLITSHLSELFGINLAARLA